MGCKNIAIEENMLKMRLSSTTVLSSSTVTYCCSNDLLEINSELKTPMKKTYEKNHETLQIEIALSLSHFSPAAFCPSRFKEETFAQFTTEFLPIAFSLCNNNNNLFRKLF